MAIPSPLLLILYLNFLTQTALSNVDLDQFQTTTKIEYWTPPTGRFSGCRGGSIGDCLTDDDSEEFELDSEINRRILATTRYISYGALDRNRVPCSRRGVSYYNCRIGPAANPYTRSCATIARCRG